MHPKISRYSATAILLAAAAQEAFPNVQFVGGGSASWGFYYDLVFPFPFQPGFLAMIEEKMRILSKEGRKLEIKEMMPSNAADFLRHHGQLLRAEQVAAFRDSLIPLIHFGRFFDLSTLEDLEEEIPSFGHFKLVEAVAQPNGAIRIVGTGAESKEELKKFLKNWVSFEGRSHRSLASRWNLLKETSQGWIWLPKGERIRQILLERWKRFMGEQNFELIATPAKTVQEMGELHSTLQLQKTAEIGYLELERGRGFVDQAYFRGSASLNSCLQSIEKFLKMFPFDVEGILGGKKADVFKAALDHCRIKRKVDPRKETGIEFCIRDLWGKPWVGPSIRCQGSVFVASFFGSMERFFCLLLEKTGGELPFWLAPEQIRVICLKSKGSVAVVAELEKQGWRVAVDAREAPLAERIHDALQERVPYSIVLGDRESQSGKLSVRIYGSEETLEMTLETLISRLKTLEN